MTREFNSNEPIELIRSFAESGLSLNKYFDQAEYYYNKEKLTLHQLKNRIWTAARIVAEEAFHYNVVTNEDDYWITKRHGLDHSDIRKNKNLWLCMLDKLQERIATADNLQKNDDFERKLISDLTVSEFRDLMFQLMGKSRD